MLPAVLQLCWLKMAIQILMLKFILMLGKRGHQGTDQEVVGMVIGSGFDARIKPDSMVQPRLQINIRKRNVHKITTQIFPRVLTRGPGIDKIQVLFDLKPILC